MIVTAVIRWPKGRRRLDYDAAVSVLKPVLDGLTDAGWWKDDRQVVGIVVTQEINHQRGEIIVMVDIAQGVLLTELNGSGVLSEYITEDANVAAKKPMGTGKKEGKGGKYCPDCGQPTSKCKC